MSITSDAFKQSLERERLAIWESYPTEQARQHVWAQRKAQFVSYLFNEHATPRSMPTKVNQQSTTLRVKASGQVRHSDPEMVL